MPRREKRTVKSETPQTKTRVGRTAKAQAIQRKRRSSRPVIAVALLLVGAVAAVILISTVANEVSPWQYSENISPADAQKMASRGAQILDVRSYEEYVSAHIARSLWIPLEDLTSLMQALPHDKLIIVVCRSGVRSIQGRNILLASGWTQVTSMEGGMQAWIAAGYPTVSGEPVRNN